jgi:hypothetical protein
MAFVSDFTFNNISRIGNDNTSVDQNTIQNTQSCNYLLQNYFSQDCTMSKARALATSQPYVNYSGSFGLGPGGCNVDQSSKLLIGTIQTNPKSKIDLFHRPYGTIPYLGRGSVDPLLESQIQNGETNTNRRTVTRLTEKNYGIYTSTPMIPEIKQNIQNPNNLIEGAASDGWIRGGVPSRELTRDKSFYNN